jgi:Ca-activated chloride channel family protein
MTEGNSHQWNTRLRLDLESSPAEARAIHHLLVEIGAPELTEEPGTEQAPLSLALVIDASGSMAGEPLEFARRAARGVVEGLAAEDRLSLVSFADDSIVHCKALAMDATGRSLALEAIDGLHTRGTTNLSGGWLDGCECVDSTDDNESGFRKHVVLLSDGHANQGIQDPSRLARHAGEILARGVATSAVGIGDGYSTYQLAALVEHGGGRLHDAERPEEIIEVLLAELGEMRAVAADKLVVHVQLPEGVLVENLNGCPEQVTRSQARFSMGSIGAGRKRELAIRILCREASSANELPLKVTLEWCAPGSDEIQHLELGEVCIERKGSQEGAYDPDVCARIATHWQSNTVRQVLKLKEEGLVHDAGSLLREHLHLFALYCTQFSGGGRLLRELKRLEGALHRHLSPRSYKEMSLAHFKRQKGTTDHRTHERGDWTTFLEDSPRRRR